jgi:transglutaminase-like putative cysteine protease
VSLVYFSPPRVEATVAGDVVSTRRARFRSQQDQIVYLRNMVDVWREVAAIRARARDIVFRLNNCPVRNEVAYAIAIGRWVQGNITYVKELPEVFQTPTATVALGYGDCDDMSTLTACLLEGVGIESELVGLEWDAPPGTSVRRAFQHIFCRAKVGKWAVPLDSTLQRPIEQLTDPIRIGRERGLRLRIFVA